MRPDGVKRHPLKRRAFGFRMLALALGLFGAPVSLAAEPVVVFAAASLKTALDEVAKTYANNTSIGVTISYAGSSALARQVENGAPADIFISANSAWMDALGEQGLIVPESRRDLLGNRLVLIAPTANASNAQLADPDSIAGALRGERFAVALINAVPAGIYAREALEALGLWNMVQPHIAQTSNVRAALRLVSLGEAPLGIVYATDARADTGVKVLDQFPPELHAPILYPVALLSREVNHDTREFYEYLNSPEATDIFRAHGFLIPGESGE